MKQLDDVVGGVMDKLKADGLDKNTIVVFTTDNGTENFTWPDGGNTPFAAGKGTIMEGGMRVPMIARWPDHIPAGKVENGIISGLDFFPTLTAIAGDANIKQELLTGKQLGDKTYKVHLDGYDQTPVLTGKGPSNRHEIFYFAEGTLGAVRIDDWKFRMIDQPDGWLGGTVHLDWPILSNLRLDPFERMQFAKGNNGSFMYGSDFYAPRVLALRLPAAEGRRIRPDLHRLPADAARRELQSRSRQGRDRGTHQGDEGKDGIGGERGLSRAPSARVWELGRAPYGPPSLPARRRGSRCAVIQGSNERAAPGGPQVTIRDLRLGAGPPRPRRTAPIIWSSASALKFPRPRRNWSSACARCWRGRERTRPDGDFGPVRANFEPTRPQVFEAAAG